MSSVTSAAPVSPWRPNDSFATRVKLVRMHLGDSQRSFAERTGLTYGEIQSIESGARVREEIDKGRRIALATRVDREWLLFGGPLAGDDGPEDDPNSNGTTRRY